MRAARYFHLVALLAVAGCFVPDVDALKEKLIGECRVTPPMPYACQLGPSLDHAFQASVQRAVDSYAEEQCILSIECPLGGAFAQELEQIGACLALSGGSTRVDLDSCHAACQLELYNCGAEESCGPLVVERCFSRYDGCKDWCNMTLGLGPTQEPQLRDSARFQTR